jgi:hypothetical protein
MSRDQTRNIETFKIGGTHMNEFEFHQHQGEMAERFGRQSRGADSERKPLTKAEQVQKLMEQAHKKAQRRKKKIPKAMK